MGRTVSYQDKKILIKISALERYFAENGDQDAASKAHDLGVKFKSNEFSIAFCGHFSAGKSSMINRLVGENLLPSSPIPTSANLVKVKKGEDYAKVIFKDARPRLYTAPYDYEKVKSYCKNGDEIKAIEISNSQSKFPEGVLIIDTPGIDSTDDAHRIATESALHLADVVFYVMDYNHVQSEPNFLFTKELTQAGKALYLVINQIDKHHEEQLSFEDYKDSVISSFASWGVYPSDIFYTSLKEPGHEHNDFSRLKAMLWKKIDERSEALPISVQNSLKKLTDEHLHFIKEQDDQELTQLKNQIEDMPVEDQNHLYEKIENCERKLEELQSSLSTFEEAFQTEMKKVLENAYLMPFQTRELAEAYLQSKQPDFKVGLFFTKQKTQEEQNQRLDRFFHDLAEKVTSQLDWHLKELLNQFVRNYESHSPALLEKIQRYSVPFTKDVLESCLKPGARVSGEYVLNYTEDVANTIKKLAKAKLEEIKNIFSSILNEKNSDEKLSIETEYQRLKKYEEVFRRISVIDSKLVQADSEVASLLAGDMPNKHEQSYEELFVDESETNVEVIRNSANETSKLEKPESDTHEQTLMDRGKIASGKERVSSTADRHLHLVAKMREAANELGNLPGLSRTAHELGQKAERLSKKEFTVALFGAFSAGKSSFANALLGENILPVSPNPTTAAINKIKPVDDHNPHGKVLVKLKAEAEIFEEVRRALLLFDIEVSSFSQAISKFEAINQKETEFNSLEKTYFSFLTAFSKGFNDINGRFGQQIEVNLSDFRDFVAKEEKSCFVEWIEVYYDCPLTKEGITLVDTPGADSIHARHTGVAFDYIKNSDAILFVTYYNHAFSRADREFLIQLGRVKDTFALDKMFFIINAIDLANDEEELTSVMNYVREQLNNYGIIKPSMFPVSSLEALKEKASGILGGSSRLHYFEEAFYHFISDELMDIAISAGKADLSQAANILESMITSAEEDVAVKNEKRILIQKEKNEILEKLQTTQSNFLKGIINQETDELVYYIKQRVFFRFSDFFKESFNPSLLKDDGRNLKKALKMALDDLIETMGFDFAQEMRATTLRIEAVLSKNLQEAHHQVIKELQTINKDISFSRYELNPLEAIDFELAFSTIDKSPLAKVLSIFKSPKAFFEKNDKKLMAEKLEELLQIPSESYLKEQGDRLKQYYREVIDHENDRLITDLKNQTEEYYVAVNSALNNEVPVEQLKMSLSKIKYE